MKIRVLIVDDELLGRMKLRQLLAPEADVEVIGECGDRERAIDFIQLHLPDLVFMDIELGAETGLDVLRALPANRQPPTIFVTAHRRYALQAFDFRAVDYLLKPVTSSRFREAMLRARERLLAEQDHENEGPQGSPQAEAPQRSGHLAVKTGGQTVFVPVEAVDYVESAGNYAILHVGSESHILRETLTNLEARLPAERFLRVSRSAIVNLTFVDRARQAARRDRVLLLKNGKEIPVTCGIRKIRRRLAAH